MKKRICVFFIVLFLIVVGFPQNVVYAEQQNDVYYLGGIPAGFSITERGAKIINTCDVLTEKGLQSPSKEADLNVDDYILYIDNNEINNAKDIAKYVNNSSEINLQIMRNSEVINKKISPIKDIYGNYKLGVIIADDTNGIGTITYFNNGRFASLGHAIYGTDKQIFKVYSGEIFEASITGVIKGKQDKAGELKGIIFKDKVIGKIDKNLICGCYGQNKNKFEYQKYSQIEVGTPEIGNAEIYTTIAGSIPKKYSIQIVKKDSLFKDDKNLVIKITDENLISITGGIVQGMSGSPIIQNGKLVGAVTHVFVNDSTRGYGISIDKMINN